MFFLLLLGFEQIHISMSVSGVSNGEDVNLRSLLRVLVTHQMLCNIHQRYISTRQQIAHLLLTKYRHESNITFKLLLVFLNLIIQF